jgi:LuxR family transcriptional regulator, maltose regulon positive regulatory protein
MGTAAGDNREEDPRLARHIIARPRVIRLLDETDARVRILSAPAGYGKTTAARQWLRAAGGPAAWYEANSASADVAALSAGVVKAATRVLSSVGTLLSDRLRAGRGSVADPDLLAEAVESDLSGWPRNAWLVIDDYHNLMESPLAERFVQRLLEAPDFRLLLLTRRRPSWLTARQLIYGEVCELGTHALAMTAEEASLVLKSVGSAAVTGLVALAQGWPAVIGLAALTTSSLDNLGDRMPEALHSYLAEELYQAAPEELRLALLQLSFAPTIDVALANSLFGAQADQVLEEAIQFGFLAPQQDPKYDLHPLLRKFLLAKAEQYQSEIATWCEQISGHLRDVCAWDDLFTLVELVPSEAGYDMLIEGALAEFLRDGRVVSVERWTTEALSHGIRSPQLELAEAEVLFRGARHREAEERALSAANSLGRHHPLRSRALYRAAQSAQLDDRATAAISRHREAAETAVDDGDRSNALWGQFVAHAESDNREEALRAASEYERTPSSSPDYRLRRAHARLSIAVRWEGVGAKLDHYREYTALLTQPADPLIQTGLAQVINTVFLMGGEYAEALKVADQEAAIAERVGLEFVRPHVLVTQAAAHLGQRDFVRAREALKRAYKEAERLVDKHSLINSTMLEGRLNLVQLNPKRAGDLLDRDWGGWPSKAIGAEYLALQAVVHACLREEANARERITDSAQLSSQIEAEMYRTWAGAIADHAAHGRRESLTAAFESAWSLGHVDSVISAYRSYPAMLGEFVNSRSIVPRLRVVLTAGRDHAHAKRAGLRLPVNELQARRLLTARELEVAALIHQGLSNMEIAKTLWISESTAKVHVRNILRKLGARTRTEAAVLLADRL